MDEQKIKLVVASFESGKKEVIDFIGMPIENALQEARRLAKRLYRGAATRSVVVVTESGEALYYKNKTRPRKVWITTH